ncbi:LysM peptidoglycan-binding domain-containing protein [Paenibacillus whitsoniae]|uniref:LysM peptidoglycan-binding domain-containing protein n=1 Tax=Paenibacillus whitsoniae TaxID=2496558 RepID=A0A3S0A9T9_9BACL|nr:LysM peptidoglycan-binding domain-containing protein [Paenibacillus whitsoniae]RTE08029.1 LysM peptidoglycan-binding domain-containing protein [Paenibacillus whitsoniae]
MFEQPQPGLRFDIYERVHLQENVAAIQELNEVELLPHIQVLTLDEQAILKGNLLLTGSYTSEDGESTRTLEHLIPVEISLPLSRVHRVEDIQVDIENFDIDLLSSRSLNVTGVLSLQGIEIISAPQESWREEEEVTFVHQIDTPRSEPVAPYGQAPAMEPETVQVPEPEPVVAEEPPAAPMPQVQPVQPVQPIPQVQPAVPEPVYTSPITASPAPAAMYAPEVQGSDSFGVDVEQIELKVTPHADSTVVTEEKKELKVAFGKKASEAKDVNPYGIKSLLSKAGSYLSDKRDPEAEAKAALADEARIDAVEWTRLFLNRRAESEEFRKVKMCIVQKEDTLETIAKRYQITTRELQLMNRLGDNEITAGQVIYLPKS